MIRAEFMFEDQNDYLEINFSEDRNIMFVGYFAKTSEEEGEVEGKEVRKPGYTLIAHSQFDLPSMFKPTGNYDLHRSHEGTIVAVENTTSRDIEFPKYLKRAVGLPVANLYFHSYAGEFVVFSFKPLKTSYQNVQTVRYYSTSEVLKDVFPDYAQKRRVRETKREMLGKLDPNESLAVLEAQLDLLTKGFAVLLARKPELMEEIQAEFPEFRTYIDASEPLNILTVKPFDKCFKEVQKKACWREMQRDYYNTKSIFSDN